MWGGCCSKDVVENIAPPIVPPVAVSAPIGNPMINGWTNAPLDSTPPPSTPDFSFSNSVPSTIEGVRVHFSKINEVEEDYRWRSNSTALEYFEPFASGGFSAVHEATYCGKGNVVFKALKESDNPSCFDSAEVLERVKAMNSNDPDFLKAVYYNVDTKHLLGYVLADRGKDLKAYLNAQIKKFELSGKPWIDVVTATYLTRLLIELILNYHVVSGKVHGDIKPSNITITLDDAKIDKVYLIDKEGAVPPGAFLSAHAEAYFPFHAIRDRVSYYMDRYALGIILGMLAGAEHYQAINRMLVNPLQAPLIQQKIIRWSNMDSKNLILQAAKILIEGQSYYYSKEQFLTMLEESNLVLPFQQAFLTLLCNRKEEELEHFVAALVNYHSPEMVMKVLALKLDDSAEIPWLYLCLVSDDETHKNEVLDYVQLVLNAPLRSDQKMELLAARHSVTGMPGLFCALTEGRAAWSKIQTYLKTILSSAKLEEYQKRELVLARFKGVFAVNQAKENGYLYKVEEYTKLLAKYALARH